MDIPEDIMAAASAAYRGEDENADQSNGAKLNRIARAIFAERERCAKIAHDESGASDDDYGEAFDKGYRDAAAYIEAAIRTPPTGEETK